MKVIDSKDNEAHIKINTKIFQKGFEPKEFNQQRLSMPEEPIKEANSSNISWKPLKCDSNAVVFSPAKKNKNGKMNRIILRGREESSFNIYDSKLPDNRSPTSETSLFSNTSYPENMKLMSKY